MAEPSAVRRRQFPFQGSLRCTYASPERGGARSAGGGVQITQTLAAPIYGGQRSSPEPAAASGSRPCRPAAPTINPQGILRIRRIRELQFMVPEFVARTGGSQWQSVLPTGSQWQSAGPTFNPQGTLRIRRIRELQFMVPEFVARTGGSQCVQAQPALEKLKRAGLPWGQRCAIILE